MSKEEKNILTDTSNEIERLIPTEAETTLLSEITEKFRETRDQRNRAYNYFDKRNIIDYIEDSVIRFTTNIDERNDIEDWQARVHDQITRSKVLAVLGKVVSVLPIAKFMARGDEDYRKATILTSLYEYAEEMDDYEEFMVYFLMEAIVKGTAIGYEDINTKTRKKRNVKGIGSDMTVSEYTENTVTLPASIVPLEDFFPASVGITNVKKQPFCFWRSEISWAQFKNEWTMYERSEMVQPFQSLFGKDEFKPYYRDYISDNTKEGNVEILRYYDVDNDQFIIMANGIWLNPLEIGDAPFVAQPLPFNHKELPFFDTKFDFFGSDFFYGKSLPDRLSAWQDVLNVLTNMTLDQSFLSIFPPILTAGFDDIEDDYLRPGRRIPMDTGGLPLNQAVMKLDPGVPTGWNQFILQYTRRVMEEASVDAVSSGTAGQGDRTTATEIATASEGVTAVLGIFARMAKVAIKRKALLKSANILQVWTDPKNPAVVKSVLGEDGAEEVNGAFNTFNIRNTVLTGGKRGTKIIEFYKNRESLPGKDKLQAREAIFKKETGSEIDIDAITPGYIRNFRSDVETVVSPKSEGSREVEKAIQLEKIKVYKTFFPNLINDEELLATTAEKMGDDPSKIINKNILAPQPETPGGAMDQTMPQNPAGNETNNAVRGAQLGGSNQLRQLSSQLTG